jgi:carbon monoxide dehydrogenase subunit G
LRISQQFTVARPIADVWEFFQDIPAVARCMPGAELTEDKGDGLYAGKVKARLGPFGASFEGEANVTSDPATRSGHVEGKGVDKRGGSRSRMVMDYRLAEVAGGTEVSVDADVTLAGAIAQFGRTSLLQETAKILVRDFAEALEARLASREVLELIIATNPTVEGDATAHYLGELATRYAVQASRIAHGVPLGGELEYVDGGTLSHAFYGRRALD